MLLLLKCPRCNNKMKYSPKSWSVSWSAGSGRKLKRHMKRCVYCGKTFRVEDNIIEILKK